MSSGVRFRVWGCRGSLPSPGPHSRRYGGDTTCFEICSSSGARIVIDCGSGFARLGRTLSAAPPPSLDVLVTHFHFDHLMGLGFFGPLIAEKTRVTLWRDSDPELLRRAIDRAFSPPLWPLTLSAAKPLDCARLPTAGADIGAFHVTPIRLNHPGGGTGYMVRIEGRKIVIATDHEHGDTEIDQALRAAADSADLLVYDAPYSDADYEQRRGWGHSTRDEGLRVAKDAGVARLVLVHHEPDATDTALDQIAAAVHRSFSNALLARDDMTLNL